MLVLEVAFRAPASVSPVPNLTSILKQNTILVPPLQRWCGSSGKGLWGERDYMILESQPRQAAAPACVGGTPPLEASFAVLVTPYCLHSPSCELTITHYLLEALPQPRHSRCCLGRVGATAINIGGNSTSITGEALPTKLLREDSSGCGRDNGHRTPQASLLF